MKKISVCLATYNGERHIVRQLSSVLSQLGSADEVIISDDSSSDKTCELIANYKDNRIHVHVNPGPNGPVGNFQNALRLATGDYIFLCDQDDIWMHDKVADMVTLLHTYDLVLSDCTVVDEHLNVIQSSFFATRGSRPGFVQNLLKNSYMGCCMAFRRDVLTYALPIPTVVHMHDWWIGLLAELRGNVYFHHKPLLLYIRHGNNASPTGEGSYGWVARISNRVGLLVNLLWRLVQ
jgi:glycosyltransferase involved in cell wall biosynthesis